MAEGGDRYAEGWDDGLRAGYQVAVEQLLVLADLERRMAYRLYLQDIAGRVHAATPPPRAQRQAARR